MESSEWYERDGRLRHEGMWSSAAGGCRDTIDRKEGITFLDLLATNAGVHPKLFGYHRSLSKRFPFAIYYRVEPDVVRVDAILDCARLNRPCCLISNSRGFLICIPWSSTQAAPFTTCDRAATSAMNTAAKASVPKTGPQRESVSWVGRLAPFNGRLVEAKCLDHKNARFVKVL